MAALRLARFRAAGGFEVVAGGRRGTISAAECSLENESGALLRLGGGGGEKWRHGLRWSPRSGMCESYSRSLLRVSVAQICQALGWGLGATERLPPSHGRAATLPAAAGTGLPPHSELCEYGLGTELPGRSRVTPPRPLCSPGVREVLVLRPHPAIGQPRPLTLPLLHCPWKLESSSAALRQPLTYPACSRSRVPAPSSTPSALSLIWTSALIIVSFGSAEPLRTPYSLC